MSTSASSTTSLELSSILLGAPLLFSSRSKAASHLKMKSASGARNHKSIRTQAFFCSYHLFGY